MPGSQRVGTLKTYLINNVEDIVVFLGLEVFKSDIWILHVSEETAGKPSLKITSFPNYIYSFIENRAVPSLLGGSLEITLCLFFFFIITREVNCAKEVILKFYFCFRLFLGAGIWSAILTNLNMVAQQTDSLAQGARNLKVPMNILFYLAPPTTLW